MKFYNGYIKELNENQIFVFGSNPEGRHGAGTAKIALNNFGALYGNGRGPQGQSYALPTKNLSKGYFEQSSGIRYDRYGLKSISKEQIIENIKELYDYAASRPDKDFLIAYTYEDMNLNGYTGDEMFEMFSSIEIPNNIVFNDSFSIKFAELNNEFSI